MNRTLHLIPILLLLTSCAVAQTPTSTERGVYPDRMARIDAAINREISAGKIPGAVALVARNGEVVYHKAFGNADIRTRTPMTTDSIFRIASMTKAITTVGVMILYEHGYFRLNDPIGNYLPEFRNMQVVSEYTAEGLIAATAPAQTPIRIIDLLTHTSGLAYPFIPSPLQQRYHDADIIDGVTARNLKLADQMALLAQQPLLFEPGSRFNYGLSTDVLGYLIEVISGQSLNDFFAEHITGPLGMPDTHFYLPDDKAGRLVSIYANDPERGLLEASEIASDLPIDDVNYPIFGARSYYSGGAGLSSTARDYGRFLQMLLNEGELDGVRVLSRKSVELMRTPRIDTGGDGIADQSIAFTVVTDPGALGELGTTGAYAWGGAFYTTYLIDPKEQMLAVFMSQGRPIDSTIDQRFGTLVYQSLQ
ncbi:MAG: serine hydrolase domain-containing protein [Woeseia sp.]